MPEGRKIRGTPQNRPLLVLYVYACLLIVISGGSARRSRKPPSKKKLSPLLAPLKSDTFPTFHKIENKELRNVDWWDKWSPEEAFCVDKASELRKDHKDVIVPPKPWKLRDAISPDEEKELNVYNAIALLLTLPGVGTAHQLW